MAMYNLVNTARFSSALHADAPTPETKHHPMESMTTLSVQGGDLSISVVIQPAARKQSLRLSFAGTSPMEPFPNAHRRIESDESIESRRGYTLYSQESLASDSAFSQDHIESGPRGDDRINSNISLSNCYDSRCIQFQPTSWGMSAQESTESQVDPYLGGRALTLPTPHLAEQMGTCLQTVEITDIDRFSPVPHSPLPNNRLIACSVIKRAKAIQQNHATPLGPVRNSMESITGDMISESTSEGIIDLFPSPPPPRALARLPIRSSSGPFNQDDEADCFADWLQEIQDRFVCRQSSISKKQAILEFKYSILRSCNTSALNQELSLALDPASSRLPHHDFDTYRFTSDRRYSILPPQQMDVFSMTPASSCKISTMDGESTDACQEQEFSAEQEVQEREQLIKCTKLEEAQMCTIKDAQGRKTLFKDVIRHRQTLVVFLRFFWCAKCQDYVRSISKFFGPGTEARKQLDATHSTVVFIGTGSWQMISSYRALLECPFDFYTDVTTTSRLFRKMGLNRILLGGSSDPAKLHKTLTLWRTMMESAKSIPKLPLHYPGSFTQLGGEFCFQNLSADCAPMTPSTKNLPLNKNKCIVKKLSLKASSLGRGNNLVAPKMDESASASVTDPFRRSTIYKQGGGIEAVSHLSAVKCIYANRMKSSASHGNFYELFKSAGVEFPKSSVTKAVTIEEIEISYIRD